MNVLPGGGKITKEKLNRYGIKTVEKLEFDTISEVPYNLVIFRFANRVGIKVLDLRLSIKQKLAVLQPTNR